MAASTPESNRLLAVAVSSPSSSIVDASVFNCLSPLKTERGNYWSRLTETDTTLRSPQPVFASPHLALPQETSLGRDETLTVSSKALQDPNTAQLQLKSSDDGNEELVHLMPAKPAEEAKGDHWTGKRFDGFSEFSYKDVNYVESAMHLRAIAVEQPVGSYSIVLNGMEHNAQNVEENELCSSAHEFKHIAESTGGHNMSSRLVLNGEAMDTTQEQRGIRRHLQFEAAGWRGVGYGEPGTFRSHHYPSETVRAVSIGSHLNASEQETKLSPHWSHRNCPSLTVAEQFSAQTVVADSSAGFKPIITMKPCADSKQFMRVEPNTIRFGELNQASPKRRCRKKGTVTGESDDHKGCNCKKSKCLKLYCECFAAGNFCVESCGCTNCFNKPEYEDTIHDTRQQIESRNPLAFAPKVLKHHPMDSPTNVVEGGNGTTPASARHKRGCNCKKSKCHKKYCECYQSGVGCSDGCRCDGCKNSFGAKTAYRRFERWRNESHEKASPGQAGGRIKTAGGEHNDTSNTVFFSASASSNLEDSRGSMIQFDWQYPLAISTQQVFDSNVLQDLTNEYATCENIMNTEQSQSQSQMLAIASTPSKVLNLKTSSPDKKRVSPITFRSQEPGSSSLRSLRSGGKFILQGLPSFPPLSPYSSGENGSNDMESFANGQ